MSGLIYHQLFTPKEISKLGEFQTTFEQSQTKLRIAKDHDGDNERIFRLPLIKSPPSSLFQIGDDITVEVRLGSSLHVVKQQDPLFILISDGIRVAIGFKITGNTYIKGVEGVPDKFLDVTRLSGDDSETVALSASDWPDEFNMTFKPEQFWGSIFCTQGNGTKQCVAYGKKPDFTQGVYLELYRDKPVEEYVINYVQVTIYSARKSNGDIVLPITSSMSAPRNLSSDSQVNSFEQKGKQREVIMQQLKDFKSLEDAGVITNEEFNKQKEKLLNAMLSYY